MQGPAEGGQGVHGLLVIESEDGVDPAGELGTNCGDRRGQEDVQRVLSKKSEWTFVNVCVITFTKRDCENDLFAFNSANSSKNDNALLLAQISVAF